ncbi:hypothetical protein Tco_0857187 [Tanacetum coccineum]|uniref:Uncharacterized protein n=1 Tax=Tanacetum coccineum TaxID=301880 RepID=A0ABQ5B5M8_9ASTR
MAMPPMTTSQGDVGNCHCNNYRPGVVPKDVSNQDMEGFGDNPKSKVNAGSVLVMALHDVVKLSYGISLVGAWPGCVIADRFHKLARNLTRHGVFCDAELQASEEKFLRDVGEVRIVVHFHFPNDPIHVYFLQNALPNSK